MQPKGFAQLSGLDWRAEPLSHVIADKEHDWHDQRELQDVYTVELGTVVRFAVGRPEPARSAEAVQQNALRRPIPSPYLAASGGPRVLWKVLEGHVEGFRAECDALRLRTIMDGRRLPTVSVHAGPSTDLARVEVRYPPLSDLQLYGPYLQQGGAEG